MGRDRFIDEYLLRADEAESLATGIKDETLKSHWFAIANGYRNLAQARLLFFPNGDPQV